MRAKRTAVFHSKRASSELTVMLGVEQGRTPVHTGREPTGFEELSDKLDLLIEVLSGTIVRHVGWHPQGLVESWQTMQGNLLEEAPQVTHRWPVSAGVRSDPIIVSSFNPEAEVFVPTAEQDASDCSDVELPSCVIPEVFGMTVGADRNVANVSVGAGAASAVQQQCAEVEDHAGSEQQCAEKELQCPGLEEQETMKQQPAEASTDLVELLVNPDKRQELRSATEEVWETQFEPKRPPSGFFLFCAALRLHGQRKLSSEDIQRIPTAWETMDEAAKGCYQAAAKEMQQAYDVQTRQWQHQKRWKRDPFTDAVGTSTRTAVT
jgi:hypothetical protein